MQAHSKVILAWRSLLRSCALASCLLACCAQASSAVNPALLADVADAQWQGCPQTRLSGLKLIGFPLQFELEQLNINLACISPPQTPTQLASLAEFKAPILQLFSQLEDWAKSLPASQVRVKRVKLELNPTTSIQGELSFRQQAQHWLVQWHGDDGSHFTIQLQPQRQQLKLSGQLQPSLVTALAAFWPSLGAAQAYGPLELELKLTSLDDLLLDISISLPQLASHVNAQLRGWEKWQLHVNNQPFDFAQWRVPASRWLLQAGRWQVEIEQWQTSGQGQWQLEPQLSVQGELNAKQLPLLQRHLYPLAGSELLSGAGQVNFAWQAGLLRGHVSLDSLNALWGEQRLSDGRLSGDFSYRPEQGWQHSGSLSLETWDVGIPLSHLTARWQQQQAAPLGELAGLELSQAHFSLLGGQAELSPLNLDFPTQAVLNLQRLKLAELVALYPELGLSVAGSVSGSLPIHLSQHGLAISAGELAVVEPAGKITLSHQSLAALKAQHPSLDFALRLLEDFDYETLAANVDFAEDGQLDMQVKLYGRNPKVSSRPVALNYRHQENIYQLLRSLRIGDQLSGQLQQWIDEHSVPPSR
ncbi:intermembrane phospholipid transport protein YdbH family protein [Agarivorans sp.]|uniref:intermembrane phospholipid transport protein YdbH family protein n=1 Tax=Agarivorans sp. TaxID=1872412 RepID=UPI003CFD5B6B